MAETNSVPQPDATPQTFFAGRAALYARLQQHTLDPPQRQAMLFMAHDGVGKSALLQHFPQVFDDQLLSIYVPLASTPLSDMGRWLGYLMEQINALLATHDFSLSRLPQIADLDLSFQDWFRDIYLNEVLTIIRPHRRLVWLLDDIQFLLDALPEQVKFLYHLLQTYDQLAIVVTLDTAYEQRLPELTPLVNIAAAERLHRLSEVESTALIRRYAPGANDDLVAALFEATGGHPRLLTHFGRELHKAWVTHTDTEALKIARPAAYAASHDHFRHMWSLLSRNERLVLTAIASLIYDDPLQPVTPSRLETWLVETDYPMDRVSINAALRGLDYQDIAKQHPDGGVQLVAGLLQTWLLEYARLDEASSGLISNRLSLRLILMVLAVLLLLLVLLVTLPTPILKPSLPVATVTLGN